ncbi:AraC family transcriptional regulator [Paenibacillus sp. GCM10023252]|uniref:AraC family transcriptional regulator n=1 Tax=Paenibacillus sp. GCM10023252 TaxID=3252649 RepID=UPI00361B7A06
MDQRAMLLEPMDMPNPLFPIKVHRHASREQGLPMFPIHWHAHMEFLYIQAGEAEITCGSELYRASAGDVVVVNSRELHHGFSRSDNLKYDALIVDLALLMGPSSDTASTRYIERMADNSMTFCGHIRGDKSVTSCLSALIHELDEKGYGYELAVKSLLFQLAALLVRDYVAAVRGAEDSRVLSSNLERFAPVLSYIDEHYKDKLSVEGLAGQLGLSRFHFSRLFRSLTGRTVTDYVNIVRIGHAELLLRSTSLSVSEVADATGYNDIYYFSKVFKRYIGTAPSTLRRGS